MKIKIIKGDITKVEADVIVNAANNALRNGAGTCGAIHAAAGPELETWSKHYIRDLKLIPIGIVPISPSFNMTNCDKIAHTVGPIYRKGGEFNAMLLKEAYLSTFEEATKIGARSIAFPCISTGVYGYPAEEAVLVVKQALLEANFNGTVKLVCFSDTDYRLYKKIIKPVSLMFSRAYKNLL